MDKIAIYNKKFHCLTYWDSKNTRLSIDCRNIKYAKFMLLTTEKLYRVKQLLEIY